MIGDSSRLGRPLRGHSTGEVGDLRRALGPAPSDELINKR
jgi:hypothetical protein